MVAILYEDDYCMAVNKPSGMLVHRTEMAEKNERILLQVTRALAGTHVYPLHRLDRPTSGIVLFALSRDHVNSLHQVLHSEDTTKGYIAVVRGYIDQEGFVDHPLKETRDSLFRIRGGKPKEARTRYSRLATVELPYPVGIHPTARYSLADIRPLTGRRRQIRRHMKHLSHHVIGDTTYGDGVHNRFFRDHFNCRRLLLHCHELSFFHPFLEKRIHIQAPIEDNMLDILHQLNWGICLQDDRQQHDPS